jgi:hypothetical protein
MPPILIYFLTGLLLSLAIGFLCYFVLGYAAVPLFAKVFGDESGAMWGRLFRVMLVTVALCGGLTVKFYGCSGPTDYNAVAQSRESMLRHTAAQTSKAFDYEVTFLLLFAAAAAIALAWRIRQHDVSRKR